MSSEDKYVLKINEKDTTVSSKDIYLVSYC